MNQLMLRYSLRQCFLDGPTLVRGPIWQILTKDANKKHDQHQPQNTSQNNKDLWVFLEKHIYRYRFLRIQSVKIILKMDSMGSTTKKHRNKNGKSLSLWEVSKQGKSMGLPSMESRRNSSAERWDGFWSVFGTFFFFLVTWPGIALYIYYHGVGGGGGCLGMLAHIYIYYQTLKTKTYQLKMDGSSDSFPLEKWCSCSGDNLGSETCYAL